MNPRDEVRFQVIWNNLISIVEEQARTLMRTAFSPVVRDSGDLSAALFDQKGRMLAQAKTGTPGHVNATAAAVPLMLGKVPDPRVFFVDEPLYDSCNTKQKEEIVAQN